MKHLVLPDGRTRRLPFYLAMEEWAARALPADDYFFTWIVRPTVIIGRNQDIEKEVNLAYCRENGIDVCRRRSGGGCVFADLNNIMVSFVTPSTDVTTTFHDYTARVASQLQAMGIDAHATGRNDIVVGDRKISGNAFYHLPGRSIVHGTMLYDTDVRHMLNAITPSRAKLESKQVKSVESRIITASELLDGVSLAEFHERLTAGLADGEYSLTEADVAEVTAIERNYYRPEWLYGRSRGAAAGSVHTATRRFDGVGEISAETVTDDRGRIVAVSLTGDFFMTSDLDAAFLNRLTGVPCTRRDVAAALAGSDLPKAIPGLATDDFIELITNH